MQFQHILITGGAGFVGSNLAVMLREHFSGIRVTVVDNLRRRGSELNLGGLRRSGVHFTHGDVRCKEDLLSVQDFDLLIDCSAEPAVSAGLDGSPAVLVQNNLVGTLNCLELARLASSAFLFLSTSRVYPVQQLNALPYVEEETRYRWVDGRSPQGFSEAGVAEDFPMEGPRSLYGASKLAAEHVLGEYAFSYGTKALINRCGVIAGPGQLARVDQGVVTLWVARHYYRLPLRYTGFGGEGKQVRDILHVQDLFELVVHQLQSASDWNGTVYNVGGGKDCSISLKELTDLCQSVSGSRLDVARDPNTSEVDVRIYITDNARVEKAFGWRPRRSVEQVVTDIYRWIDTSADTLRSVLT